jgi:molecular chaperone GrpE
LSKKQHATEEVVEEVDSEETPQETPVEAEAETSSLEAQLTAQLEEVEAKAAEYLEGWQRERAELANYRKRVERERAEFLQNARIEVASYLLPVFDDFERALNEVPDEINDHDWVNGVTLIYRKLQSILETLGITEIEALGKPFDPNLHDAISQDEDGSYEADYVIEVVRKGYRYGDRVLRPAMVRVAR